MNNIPLPLSREKHFAFLKTLDSRVNRLEYWQADHIRMSGIYWALTALLLLFPDLEPETDSFDEHSPLTREQILDFVLACQKTSGGFSGNIGHNAHVTFTLSAIQILIMINALEDERISLENHINWIGKRQQENGSFTGDDDGEIDTRFSFCALASLRLLNRLDAVCLPTALEFINSCRNYDGGYGAIPGGESHAGQIYCCVGALTILRNQTEQKEQLNHSDMANDEKLGQWLAWRQLPCGGLNGRPEKVEDVCYSWWVLSSLAMLDKLNWINETALKTFILNCQDEQEGGISDRPGDVADIFHTLFGIAGLALLGGNDLASIDPCFCMPTRFIPK